MSNRDHALRQYEAQKICACNISNAWAFKWLVKASKSPADLEGGVDGLFLLINKTFLIYKQLSTTGTIMNYRIS